MRCARRSAFSLVELLVVIGVIGLLVGLILPAVQKVRGSANRIACANNLKQIGLALHSFHNAHGQFPKLPRRSPTDRDANTVLSWMAMILPYLEEQSVYQASAKACATDPEPMNNPPHAGLATVVRPYVCPSDRRLLQPLTDRWGTQAAYTSYVGIGGVMPRGSLRGLSGILESTGCRLSDITDGSSLTIMASERPPPDTLEAGWWYPKWGWHPPFLGPNHTMVLRGGRVYMEDDGCRHVIIALGPGRLDNLCDRYHLWSLHGGGANFLFADGSGRFLAYSAEPLMTALASRSGGEAVTLPD